MKISCLLAAFLFAVSFVVISSPASASTCTGEKNCRACSNCSRCAHCTSGGHCGVCSGGSSKAFDAMIDEGIRRDKKERAAAYAAAHPKPKPTPKFDPNAFHALHVRRTVIVAPQVGLRKTATDAGAPLKMLKKGDTVIVLGMQAGHYKIMLLDNKTGYVPKKAVGVIDEMLSVPVKH